MRELTLHEKINFKWHFVQKGLTGENILRLTIGDAMLWWSWFYGYKSIGKFYKLQYKRDKYEYSPR